MEKKKVKERQHMKAPKAADASRKLPRHMKTGYRKVDEQTVPADERYQSEKRLKTRSVTRWKIWRISANRKRRNVWSKTNLEPNPMGGNSREQSHRDMINCRWLNCISRQTILRFSPNRATIPPVMRSYRKKNPMCCSVIISPNRNSRMSYRFGLLNLLRKK